MRTRSPRMAPPLNGLLGSTASTPTARSSARHRSTIPSARVLLPLPGGPVSPTTWAWPARPRTALRSSGSASARSSTMLMARARARTSPSSSRSARSIFLLSPPGPAESRRESAPGGGSPPPVAGIRSCASTLRLGYARPGMWQREAVLEATGRLLDSAGEGRGGTLLVVGEAGLGKTSILDHARRLAAGRARVGAGRGDPMESALPFGLFSQALGMLDGPDLRGGSGIPAATPGATFYQVLRWIEAQGPVPILLALDDLHWADEDSLGLLSSLCRRIGDRAVAVMGTLRPWPPRAREVASALVG